MAIPSQTPLGTPPADIQIDRALVRHLLAEQYPELASLPIHLVDAGWDNAIARLGDRYAVRLPRRKVAAPLITNEQIWLPLLAARLPLPVPTPLFVGAPSSIYPWRWSIVPWLTGNTVDLQPLSIDPAGEQADANPANIFASFLSALHVPAPPNAPTNPFRGVSLTSKAAVVQQRLERLSQVTNAIAPNIMQSWQTAVEAPIDSEPTWIHGDLHPRNVLASNGQLTGVIDWGDMASGDPATDLAAFWMVFPEQTSRQRAMEAYGCISSLAKQSSNKLSRATVLRAKGWAIYFGSVLLETGRIDNPRHAKMGERILHCVASDRS